MSQLDSEMPRSPHSFPRTRTFSAVSWLDFTASHLLGVNGIQQTGLVVTNKKHKPSHKRQSDTKTHNSTKKHPHATNCNTYCSQLITSRRLIVSQFLAMLILLTLPPSLTYLHTPTFDLGDARSRHRVQLKTEARSTRSDLINSDIEKKPRVWEC